MTGDPDTLFYGMYHSGATGTWQAGKLIPGQSLREPKALFIKLDEGVVEEELARMGAR